MYSNQTISVTAVGIIKEGEWHDFKPVAEAVIRDPKIKTLIIVNVDSDNLNAINLYQKQYAQKIILINADSETDQSKLFETATNETKKTHSDFIFFLEKNCVPEYGTVDSFTDNYKYFDERKTSKIILIANTIDVAGKEKSFYNSTTKKDFKDGTLFDVLSYKKIKSIVRGLLQIEHESHTAKPLFPSPAYIGSGAFVPMSAVEDLAVNADQFPMYAADTDMAWNIKKLGYSFYQCKSPIVRKVTKNDATTSHHVFGMFDVNTKNIEVHNHIRNAVLVSRKHTQQSRFILLVNVIIWTSILLLLGLGKTTSFKFFFKRAWLIIKSTINGYHG